MHYAARIEGLDLDEKKEHDETMEDSQKIDPFAWYSLHQTSSFQLKLLAQPRAPIHGVQIIRDDEDCYEAQYATVKACTTV